MRLRQPLIIPHAKSEARSRAIRLEAVSLGILILAALLIYLTLGQSQAMKTAWVSDLLALIPPIAFLVASRFELRAPSPRYPFGYTRAVSVAFLITAVMLLITGAWLLLDGVMKLL